MKSLDSLPFFGSKISTRRLVTQSPDQVSCCPGSRSMEGVWGTNLLPFLLGASKWTGWCGDCQDSSEGEVMRANVGSKVIRHRGKACKANVLPQEVHT